jgi:HEAT repeat protein
MQHLSEVLSSDDYLLRTGAAWSLSLLGHRAKPILHDALHSKSWQARHAAAYIIWLLRDPTVVPDLIEALRDSEWQVREAAAEALGQLDNPTSVPALIAALRDPEVYEAAVYALRELADTFPAPELHEALNHENKLVRMGAAFALGEKGGLAAVPVLLDLVRAGGISGDRGEFEDMTKALAGIGKPAIPSLLEALQDKESEEVRFFTAEVLGWIRDPVVIPHLVSALDDENEQVQEQAVYALEALGEDTTPILIETLSHPSKYVQGCAASALSRANSSTAKAAVEAWWREQRGQQT